MDAFEIEKLRQHTLRELSESVSPKQKSLILKNFYQTILKQSDKDVYEAFLVEFLQDFLDSIKGFEVFFLPPEVTREIIWILHELLFQNILESQFQTINQIIKSIESELKQLENLLNGENQKSLGKRKLFFPLLEKHLKNEYNLQIGTLETLTINIKKNNEKNHFIIVPSFESIDKDLHSQIENSWLMAVNYLRKNGKKLSNYHTVIIHFDHHWGNYEGISAGAALTISFIEELVSFYNASVIISIKDNIAITGGFNNVTGNAIIIDDQIIKTKLKMVFYSFIQTFIVPEENKTSAISRLKELQRIYPNRLLEIVGINTLADIINRRDLIAIKKQNPVVITTKFMKRNWVSSLFLLAIILLTGYFYETNFDNKPAILQRKGQTLFVENKDGKVLYSKVFEYRAEDANNPYLTRNYQMLVDIYHDGRKELIAAGELQGSLPKGANHGSITFYNYKGEEIWNYIFKDTMSSPGERLSTNYGSYLIDTATVKNKMVLVAYCNNSESFGAAIYMLDLKSGKRVFNTFWHPGFVNGGYIIRSKDNKNKDLVFYADNNSWHKFAIGMLNLNNIKGKAPSDRHHDYYGEKIASLKQYILLPHEDYMQKITPTKSLYSGTGDFRFNENENIFSCEVYLDSKNEGFIGYDFSLDLSKTNIVIGDDYARIRDPYVKSGRLKPPLSDTQEYRNLLISQILYWNGHKFVKKYPLK